jgi:hypothetical protein
MPSLTGHQPTSNVDRERLAENLVLGDDGAPAQASSSWPDDARTE